MPVLLPLLIAAHVACAVALLLPSVCLPFLAAARGPRASGRGMGLILRLEGLGTNVLGLAVALTGLGLLVILGTGLLARPWLLAALGLYAATLGLAFFVQRPGLRRLLPGDASSGPDPRRSAIARRGRYVSYLIAGGIGTIGFLMSTKPNLW